jgi:hypothetical protein
MMIPNLRDDKDRDKPLDIYQKLAAGTAVAGIVFLLVWSIYETCVGK